MIIQKAPFFRLFALLLILSAVFVLALSIGPGGFVNPLWFNNETEAGILRYRLLRVSAGVLVGTALGVAGLCIQRVTRNPLADPYLIGISSGATLGILLSMIVGLEPHVWPLLSFLGGLLALSFTLTASALAGYSPLSLIVAGVSVSYLFYSLNVVLLTLYHAEIRGSPMMWLFGSLAYVKMNELFIAFSIVLLGVSIVLVFHKELDVLVLEDDVAESLGVRRSLVRALSTGAATLAATAATTISGPIGFVGIVAPWIARLLSKEGFLELSIASGLIGSTIVVLADLTIRGIFGGVEIPVTAMTAVIGAPLLAYMLLKLQSYG